MHQPAARGGRKGGRRAGGKRGKLRQGGQVSTASGDNTDQFCTSNILEWLFVLNHVMRLGSLGNL